MSIEISRLQWHCGGTPILNDISFTVDPGSVTAIMGPNGSGKTTLLNLISGWLKPTRGAILIDGVPLSPVTPERVAELGILRRFDPPKIIGQLTLIQNLVIAGRENGLWPLLLDAVSRTAQRNIANAVREQIEPVLSELRLQESIDRPASELSIGQAKLLDLALAFYNSAKYKVLDEPLKERIEKSIREIVGGLLRRCAQAGSGVLFVEHDIDFVLRYADRVVALDSTGQIAIDEATAQKHIRGTIEDVYRQGNLQKLDKSFAKPDVESATAKPRLHLENLSVGYSGAPVVRDASLKIAPGEVVVLRGRNGAGKSTLFLGIMGLLKTHGKVALDDNDVSHLRPFERVGAGMTLVTQENRVFDYMTVRENLLLGGKADGLSDGQLVRRASELFPALGRVLKQSAAMLSAGQKQMVALARTFLHKPSCILLDEPFAGLDPAIRGKVRTLIDELAAAGTAFIIAEHGAERAGLEGSSYYEIKGGILHRLTGSN